MYFVALLMVTMVFAADKPKKPELKKCLKNCDAVKFEPICAGIPNSNTEKPKSFGSKCILENYNCEHDSSKISKII